MFNFHQRFWLLSISLIYFSFALSSQAQVLTQVTKELGHGYRSQESQQVNVAQRWHSEQSFKFLYFQKRYLCQCSHFSISPSGKYAIFQHASHLNIAVFNQEKSSIQPISKLSEGKLHEVTWGKDERQIEISIASQSDHQEKILKKKILLK